MKFLILVLVVSILGNSYSSVIYKRQVSSTSGYENNDDFLYPCPNGFNPCSNDGICLYSKNTNAISCACRPSFSGIFCEKRDSICDSSPCKNGGICNPDSGIEARCICPLNYGGLTCEVPLTCSQNPCKNNQLCFEIGGFPQCVCSEKFYGQFCEYEL